MAELDARRDRLAAWPSSTSRWPRRRACAAQRCRARTAASHGNRELIGQALANLIDNALKYGAPAEPGSAPRDGRARQRGAATSHAHRVADRGPGIPEADRGRVLERFVRLEASRSKPGFGLGLSLAAGVARLHGGQLRLEDNAPGLRVVIALPAPSAERGAGETPVDIGLADRSPRQGSSRAVSKP